MNALARESRPEPGRRGGGTPEVTWAEIALRAPLMVATMASYLDQLEVSARPSTVADAELTLRLFAHRVSATDPDCVAVAGIGRGHIEDFKRWLVARPGKNAKGLSTLTIRHRLSTMRTFFERIMEWEYDDAPGRLLVYSSDFPALDEPLPKFLDHPTASKFMAALALDPNLRRRLMVELLARTGIRVGELGGLQDDAMVRYDGVDRLRIPVGKLHNDRHVPLLPMLVDLIVDYKALRGPFALGTPARTRRRRAFRSAHRAPLRRRGGQAGRSGSRPPPSAAPHTRHPIHQSGHESRGDRRLARSSFDGHDAHLRADLDRTVAEQYFKVTEAVEAEYYGLSSTTVASTAASGVQKPRPDHRRLLANGHCTRPALLDCVFESVCERCGFFETGPQFLTILKRQRKHADQRGQSDRSQLFDDLIEGVADAQ